ncbi:MAG: Fe2+-dependent dioxygenase [Steroidobacteraceae bacterium]
MMIPIPNVLSAAQVARCRELLEAAQWMDGRIGSGYQSSKAKNNMQLPQDSSTARQLREIILAALEGNLLFMSAALPARIYPPSFNRYEGGQTFGNHIDNAVLQVRGTQQRVRTDVSATLFLSNPDEYEGGELIVNGTHGARSVKLAAGHMILYPAGSIHRVTPVTRGTRLASFFWIHSLVREDAQRAVLFDMDMAIVQLRQRLDDNDQSIVALTGCYHNLLRMWATP